MALSPYSPVRARAGTAVDAATTSVTVNYPLAVAAGDLLLVLLCSDTTQTFTASGWTQLGSTVTAQSESSAVFYKTAAGTEDGSTFTVGQTTTSRDFKAVCWAVAGGGTPEMGTPTTGLSVNPDPPSVTHSSGAGDYLMIVGVVADVNRTVIEWPDDLADWLTPAPDLGSIQLNTASGMFDSPTYDPAATTLQASDGWHAYTIAVPVSGIDPTGWPVPDGTPAVTILTTSSTSQSINLPSGITAGEVLVAEISNSYYDSTGGGGGSVPEVSITGWTVVGTDENLNGATGEIRGTVLVRTADGTEGATATVAITKNGDALTSVVRRFSNVDGSTIEASFGDASSATAAIPGLTPASGSDKVIWLTGLAVDASTGFPEVWAANGRYGLGGVWARTTSEDTRLSSVYSAFEGVEQAALATFNVTLEQSRRHVGYTVALPPATVPPESVSNRIGGTGAIRRWPRNG